MLRFLNTKITRRVSRSKTKITKKRDNKRQKI